MKRYQKYNSRSKPLSVRRLEKKGKRRFIFTILFALFLLYASFTWILPTLVGGLSVINKFKPEEQIQTPISENATLAPPVLNIPYEATNTARIKIKGFSQAESKVEVYLDDELKTEVKVSSDGSFTTDEITLNLGTNNLSGKTIDEKGNKSLSSKPIRIIYENEKPTLDLREPADNSTVKGDKKITVSGTTNVSKDINVTANGIRLIVNSEGQFSQVLEINEGDNNIVVIAADTAGNSAQVTRKVTHQP